MPKDKAVDPRVKRSRRYLQEALVSLIEEKGFDSITVLDLTKRADLNRATFYLHFRDKYDLLEQSMDEMLEQLIHTLAPTGNPEATSFGYNKPFSSIVRLFEHIAEHATFYKVMLGQKGNLGFTSRMLKVLREAFYQRFSLIQSDEEQLLVPKEIVTRYQSAALLGLIMYWLENNMPYSPHYMATQLTRLSLLGPHHASGLSLLYPPDPE
ncbi:MAG TPA: TetR/AcrR family transcriptional regulator [Bacillota bacterium]|nr:TetR/AcrR family transcriptional regulator [Bacillota bacterium]